MNEREIRRRERRKRVIRNAPIPVKTVLGIGHYAVRVPVSTAKAISATRGNPGTKWRDNYTRISTEQELQDGVRGLGVVLTIVSLGMIGLDALTAPAR